MSYVFISYSKKDSIYARNLTDYLIAKGYDVWIDEDRIEAGVDWWDSIVKGLVGCSAFIIVMSPDSHESEWVQREVFLALEKKKPIFPFLFSGENWPIFYRLQYVDVSLGRLPPDKFFESLSKSLPRQSRGRNVTGESSAEAGDNFVTSDAINLFEKAKSESNYSLALEILGRIRASGTIPSAFDLQEQEAELLNRIQSSNPIGAETLKVKEELVAIEWIAIPRGWVILEDASKGIEPGTKGGKYDVPRFEIAKFPVTNAQFHQFITDPDGYGKIEWWDYSDEALNWRTQIVQKQNYIFAFAGDSLPRTNVSWYTAAAYCRWYSYRTGQEVMLPTEQQWQRAAQANTNQQFPWGDTMLSNHCNYNNEYRGVTPVHQFPEGASPYGVMDMSGNIWEWCLTQWSVDGSSILGNDLRVTRGGSWSTKERFVKVTYRYWNYPEGESNELGFRCVRFA